MEGDALGSALAFYNLVKSMGKSASVFVDDNIPYGYEFLPGVQGVHKPDKRLMRTKFDTFVILDCSDLRRSGNAANFTQGAYAINIDHHISNTKFADVNWVMPQAASTTEMIYRLYKYLKVKIDRKTALLLYAGLLTDTGSFHYSNTSWYTYRVASELVKKGIDVAQVYRNIYEDVPYQDMQLLSRILPRMQTAYDGKVVWFELGRKILTRRKVCFDLSEHIMNFGRSIKGVQVILLFKENLKGRGEVRVNLRSRGKIDVNKIASFFGGGGHKTASGITMRGKLSDVRGRVLNKLKDFIV